MCTVCLSLVRVVKDENRCTACGLRRFSVQWCYISPYKCRALAVQWVFPFLAIGLFLVFLEASQFILLHLSLHATLINGAIK